jgi:penicillin-binding protein 1A
VFVGFDNPRTLGRREQGATVAAPIFRDFMKGALADAPPTPFRVPPGIDFVSVDVHSGALASPNSEGAILEAFKAGTEPGLAITDAPESSQTSQTNAPTNTNAPGTTVSQGTGGLY